MPRSFTETERKQIKKEMLETGNILMRTKNVKQITVEEITKSVNISKGSFYSFYPTREEFLWDVIKGEERTLMNEIEEAAHKDMARKDRIRHIFYDIYLRKDWLIYKLSDQDLQYLARKLPREILMKEEENSSRYNAALFQILELEITNENIEFLQSSIQMIRLTETTSVRQSEVGKKRMQHILVEGIVDSLCKESESDS